VPTGEKCAHVEVTILRIDELSEEIEGTRDCGPGETKDKGHQGAKQQQQAAVGAKANGAPGCRG
jgi:hypothetical protein